MKVAGYEVPGIGRALALKGLNKIAQGFNPGKSAKRKRPESGANPQSGCNTDRAHRSNSNPISYEQTLSRTRTTTRTRTICLTSVARIGGDWSNLLANLQKHAPRTPLFLLRPIFPEL